MREEETERNVTLNGRKVNLPRRDEREERINANDEQSDSRP